MNQIYLSTGAFTGRINGRNPYILAKHHREIQCDGFELMLFDDFYKQLDEALNEYIAEGINIPVIHADKKIGSMISVGDIESANDLFAMNCRIANRIGATKAVVHMWGYPDSDTYFDRIIKGVGRLLDTAHKYNVTLVAENSFCYSSPLKNLEKLHEIYPDMCFIIDTRCAQFHNELTQTCQSKIFKTHVKHLHISDYKGAYMDWQSMYPVLHPTEGDVDWGYFFTAIKSICYCGTVTLESASMQEKGINATTFNKSLEFIRNNLI